MSEFFKEWLKNLENNLSRRIKESRRYPAYVDEVICDAGKFYIWEKSGRDTIKTEGNVTIIQIAPLQVRLVSPTSICVRIPGDWLKWYEEKAIMGVLINGACRHVTALEEQAIIKTLTGNVTVFELDSETFTWDGLHKPIVHINSKDNFADTLLVHPLQISRLMEEKRFIPKWNLPPGLVGSKGPGFVGIMGTLSVYETIGISELTGLLYDKRQIKVRKTPLSIKFDDYDHPEILQVAEDLFAWSKDSEAIAKLILKT